MQVKGTTVTGSEKKSNAQTAANKYNADGQKRTADTKEKMEAVRSNNQSSAIGRAPTYNEYVSSKNPERTPDSKGMATNLKSPIGAFATKEEVQTGKYLNEATAFDNIVGYLQSGKTDYDTTKSYLAQVDEQIGKFQPIMAKNSLALGWRSLRTALMERANADNRAIYESLSEEVAKAQKDYDTQFQNYENAMRSAGHGTMFELEKNDSDEGLRELNEILKTAKANLAAWQPNTNEERDALIAKMHSNAGVLKGGLTAEEQQRLLELDYQLNNPDIDYGKDFVRRGALVKGMAEKGAGHVNKAVTGAANWLFGGLLDEFTALANTTLGDVGVKKELPNVISSLDKWVNDVVAADEKYFGTNVEGSSIAKTVDKYGTMTAEAIPMAVIAHLTAGSSLTTEGLTALSNLEQASGLSRIAQITTEALKAKATDPNFQFTFAQTFGQSYEEAIADGADVEEASVFALINAFTNTSIEIEGGIQGLPEALKDGNEKALRAYAKSIVDEIGEEWRQNPAEQALKGVYRPVEFYSTENEDAVINPKRAVEEAKGAAVVSAILGAGPTAVQAVTEAKTPRATPNTQGYIERHQQSTAFEEQRKQAERTAEFLKKQQEQREAMKGSEENLDTGATIEEKKPEVPKGEQKANAKAPKKPKKKAPKVKDRHTFTSDNGAVVNARIEQTSDGKWHYRDDMKNEHHPDGTDLVYDSYKEAKAHLEDLKISVKEIEEQAKKIEEQAVEDTAEEDGRPSLDELRAELAEQEAARKTAGENKAEHQAPEGLKKQEAPTATETASEAQENSGDTQTPESTQKSVKPAEERAEKKSPKNPDKAAAWKKAEAERTARNNALRADIKERVSHVENEDVSVSGTYNGSAVTAVYDGNTIRLTNSQGQQLTPITPKNRKDARKILYDIARETRGTVESTAEVEAEQAPVETTALAETETANTEEATNPEVQQSVEVETQEVSAPVEEAETKTETPTSEVETESETEPTTEEVEPELEDDFTKQFIDTLENGTYEEFHTLYENNPEEFKAAYEKATTFPIEEDGDIRDLYERRNKNPQPVEETPKAQIVGAVESNQGKVSVIEPVTEEEFRGLDSDWDRIREAKKRGEISDELWQEVIGKKYSPKKAKEHYTKAQQNKNAPKQKQQTRNKKYKTAKEYAEARVAQLLGNKTNSTIMVLDALDDMSKINQGIYDEILNFPDGDDVDFVGMLRDGLTQRGINGVDAWFDKNGALKKEYRNRAEREINRLLGKDQKIPANILKSLSGTLAKSKGEIRFLPDLLSENGINPTKIANKWELNPIDVADGYKLAFEQLTGIEVPFSATTEEIAGIVGSEKSRVALVAFMLNQIEAEKAEKAKQKKELAKLMADQARGMRYGLPLGEEELSEITEGVSQDVHAELREQNRGRICGGDRADVKESFAREESQRQGFSGEASYAVWEQEADTQEEQGARRLSAEELDEATLSAVNALLDNGIPFITVFDATNMKKSPGLFGYVVAKGEGAGVFLFVNDANAAKSSISKGVVVLHEPVHYFAGVYANNSENGERPLFLFTLDTIAEKLGIETDDLSNLEQRFSGREMWKSLGKEFTDEDWDNFCNLGFEEQFKQIVDEIGGIAAQRGFLKLFEECVANIASKNNSRIYRESGIDLETASRIARDSLYDDGIVPRGFFESIEPAATALSNAKTAPKSTANKTAEEKFAETIYGLPAKADKTPSIEDFFDYPDGATDIRQNKGIAELRSQGERIHADDVEYQSVSHQAIIDAANKTINRILNSGKYSAQDIANWFSNRSPRNADRFIMQLGKEMFYRLQQQRVSLETSGGKAVSDARLTTDVNQLSKLEESFGAWVTNAVGNAGEILGQHADLSPVVATKNNAKNSFIGNIKPGEIDPDSDGAKMYRVVDDHVSYQESINARKEAGKITEAEGAQLYAKEIMELSKIRNVRGTFGNSGRMMDAWERNMINWILKHDKHAYDTLRMLALGSTNRISSDFNNVGTVDTIKQVRYLFLLSNFATKVNNVLNNLESSTTGAIGQNIAVALTGKRAEKLMGEQTMTYNSNWGRLFPRGVNKELNEYMLTKGAESVLSLYYGLEVDEGIIDMDTGGRYNQNSSTAGRILARAQFLSGLGMQTTDAMAIARAYKGQEINIDKMNVSEARKQVLKKQAMENARAQMYHSESKAAKLMNNARDALNSVKTFGNDVTGKIGLGDILMPFVQVPTNVAMRAIRATPAGVFYSFGKYFRGMRALEARKAQVQTADKYRLMQENGVALSVDQQNYLRKYGNLKMPTDAEVVALQRAFGEGASNAAITLVAAVLAGMGGIRDFDDEDDKDLQRLAKERGFTGLQINLSHPFKKDNQDWDYDNDVIIGGSWLEVAALPVCAGYALYHAAIEDGGDFASVLQTVMTSPMRSINTIVDTAKEIPGMQQIGKIWDAYENLQYEKDLSKKGDKIVAGLTQYAANTLSTFVIPNQVAQFAAGIDNTVRDVYSADTNWEVARNIFQSKIPFWRNKLPEKKSSLGETRTYGPDTLRSIANRMIIPGTGIQIWKKSELERYYEKMSKSGHTNIMVENSAPKSIKAEGQVFDLDAKERRDFDSMRDVETRKAQEALLHSEGFLSLPEDLQEIAMRDARSLVNHLTEQYTLDNKEDCTANVDLDKWEDAYKNKYEEAAQFLTAKYGAKEFFKNNELLDAKAADAYLKNTYSKLDDTARELLDNSYAHLDSMYDAYSSTGMTAEQYWRVEQLRKKYAEQQKAEDNEESASALQRNLIVEYENMKDLTPEQKAWAEENKKLWLNIPASTETIDKIRKVTGLTAKEADDWLDLKSNTAPLGGYKKLSQNQRLMMVRDSNYSEDKKWRLIEYEASDSAWAKLVKFRDEGKTVAEALEQARWYKPTKFTRWVEQRYDVIYDQAPGEEEED